MVACEPHAALQGVYCGSTNICKKNIFFGFLKSFKYTLQSYELIGLVVRYSSIRLGSVLIKI